MREQSSSGTILAQEDIYSPRNAVMGVYRVTEETKKEIKVCENTHGLLWQSQEDVVNRECRDLFGQMPGVTQCNFCPLDNSIGKCL